MVGGFALDYEVHYDTVPPDPHFCTRPTCFAGPKDGLTDLAKQYKASTGRGINPAPQLFRCTTSLEMSARISFRSMSRSQSILAQGVALNPRCVKEIGEDG